VGFVGDLVVGVLERHESFGDEFESLLAGELGGGWSEGVDRAVRFFSEVGGVGFLSEVVGEEGAAS
jgi:hypothetical protein